MCELLLELGAETLLNRNDFITGFTPFHFALFTQNRRMLWYLIKLGADVQLRSKLISAVAFVEF